MKAMLRNPTTAVGAVMCVLIVLGAVLALAALRAADEPAAAAVVELPKFEVKDSRVLPPPESWKYAEIPGFEILSRISERETKRFVRDFLLLQEVIEVIMPGLTRGHVAAFGGHLDLHGSATWSPGRAWSIGGTARDIDLRHWRADLPGRIGRAPARIDRDAAVDPAPGRHRGGPVAALDPADIEVDRVRLALEVRTASLVGVPARLQLAQGADHPVGGVDGVRRPLEFVQQLGAEGRLFVFRSRLHSQDPIHLREYGIRPCALIRAHGVRKPTSASRQRNSGDGRRGLEPGRRRCHLYSDRCHERTTG